MKEFPEFCEAWIAIIGGMAIMTHVAHFSMETNRSTPRIITDLQLQPPLSVNRTSTRISQNGGASIMEALAFLVCFSFCQYCHNGLRSTMSSRPAPGRQVGKDTRPAEGESPSSISIHEFPFMPAGLQKEPLWSFVRTPDMPLEGMDVYGQNTVRSMCQRITNPFTAKAPKEDASS